MTSLTHSLVRHVAATLTLLLAAGTAQADILSFDSAGDTAGWTTDRYDPAGFTSGVTMPEDGRTGTLRHEIRPAQSASNRPASHSSAFYNTQGKKYDLPMGQQSLFVDLYVDDAWSGLNQNVAGSEGRLASLWATGSSLAGPTYPIIEFNNDGTDTFRIWEQTGIWTDVAGFTGYDQWYQIGFDILGSTFRYFVNGHVVYQTDNAGTLDLDNVILQGYNAGNSYDIYWDNLTSQAVPEPSSLALLGMGTMSLLGVGWRKRRQTPLAS